MGGADEGGMTSAAKGQADADKTRWEARKAEIEAEQAARENAEWDSEAARRRRAAEQASATAKAELETAEARQKQLTSLLPNLSGVRGETKVSGDQPIYGQALARRALERAAVQVAAAVKAALGDGVSILVTCDPDLADSDSAYLDVTTGLEELTAAADRVLAPPALEMVAPAAIGAVAAAIPSVLSLLSAHRSITTTSGPADDMSAAASVAGALVKADPGALVRHDGFRTLSGGSRIYQALGSLRQKRRALAARVQLAAADEGTAKDEAAEQAGPVIAAIDQFVASVTAVAPEGRRSALTSAALREGLHDGTVRHVLLVTASSSSSSQLVNDRPLMWKDAFCVVAAASVTYLLVQTSDGRVVAGGTGSGTATLRGKINSQIVVEQTD
jgi:chromosome segregation ATPase